jgi:hypothetical protein
MDLNRNEARERRIVQTTQRLSIVPGAMRITRLAYFPG